MVDDVQGLEGAVGLRSLVLTFNELTSMEGLTPLTRLTSLDLSFNAITRIQALKVGGPLPLPASANGGMHDGNAFSPHMLSLLICSVSLQSHLSAVCMFIGVILRGGLPCLQADLHVS